MKTQPGPNSYCSALLLSDPQQTHGQRNKKANLYQKTYSNFRRLIQPELHGYPLHFCWVKTTLILPPLEQRRLPVTRAPKLYTFGLPLLFAKLLKPQVLSLSIEVAKESYQTEGRDRRKAGAWKGTFWWILFTAFSAVWFHLTEAENNLWDKDLLPAVLATRRQHRSTE